MWRRSSVVRVIDAEARARRRARARDDGEELVVGALWVLFGWRVELFGLGVIVGVERWLAGVVGEAPAAAVVVLLVGAGLAHARRGGLTQDSCPSEQDREKLNRGLTEPPHAVTGK